MSKTPDLEKFPVQVVSEALFLASCLLQLPVRVRQLRLRFGVLLAYRMHLDLERCVALFQVIRARVGVASRENLVVGTAESAAKVLMFEASRAAPSLSSMASSKRRLAT